MSSPQIHSTLKTFGVQALASTRRQMGIQDIPFPARLSMLPLLRFWERRLDHSNLFIRNLAREIIQYANSKKSLFEPYEDANAFLLQHNDTLEVLFSGVLPMAMSQDFLGYAAIPFYFQPFYLTKGLRDLFEDGNSVIEFQAFEQSQKIPYPVRACLVILHKCYGLDVDLALPYLFRIRGYGKLPSYYKATPILDFFEVKVKGDKPDLSNETIEMLLRNLMNEELWLQHISPEIFSFEGFFLSMLNDVTEVQIVSSLRRKLLHSESLFESESWEEIRDNIKIYLGLEEIEIGLAAMNYPAEDSMAHRYNLRKPIIPFVKFFTIAENKGSMHDISCREMQIQIVHDLSEMKAPRAIERALIAAGYRSLMVMPLWDNKRIIGILELASKKKNVFNYFRRHKIKEILPLFDIAIQEARDKVELRLKSTIQQQYTNIHESMLWRFNNTALDYLEELNKKNKKARLKPIVFRDVYPIYGHADVIASVERRNAAIKQDLSENLILAKSVLAAAFSSNPVLMPVHLLERIEHFQSRLDKFTAVVELKIAQFLKEQLHPFFREIVASKSAYDSLVSDYFQRLNPRYGTVYDARRAYEIKISDVNQIINRSLESSQAVNQRIIPHYFKKFKTDGIEYEIYLGQSILQHLKFDAKYIRELRLWQIENFCLTARALHKHQSAIGDPMRISYLIFVYDYPMSIRFRMDEKQFDPDGSYNLRYEIVKKRLDKATLSGSSERLTKDNHIAIVFFEESSTAEYKTYVQQFINVGWLADEIDEVELQPVQGITGLKAWRLPIILG